MISIIICSINPSYLQRITDNIRNTIGIEYELLVFDNRIENLPICRVYNKMALKSLYPYILFLHEDVVFKTQAWGQILLCQLSNDPKRGVIGLAGSTYKSVNYSGWFTGLKKLDYFNIIHEDNGHVSYLKDQHSEDNIAAEVKVLDGVFMACKKTVWQDVQFNESLLSGFHFYDIDFSLRASSKYKNIVIRNLNLVHYTGGGDFGEAWVQTALLYHKNYSYLMGGTKKEIYELDSEIYKIWLDILKDKKILFRTRIKWIMDQKQYFRLSNIYSIIRFLTYRPFGLFSLHRMIKKLKPD